MFILILVYLSFMQVSCFKTECKDFKYCGDCVATASCAWCMASTFDESRCGEHEYIKTKCINNFYPNKELEEIMILNDTSFGVHKNKIIQLKPQKIKIKTRPGKENVINLFYKPKKDYPLDVYYLVDNSYTMKLHKVYLAKEIKNITIMLEALTNNVLLGFGTFVEKPTLPFARKFTNAYSYKNHLSLMNNTTIFSEIVLKIKDTGNLDVPEAMFDGLMQAMLCKDEIGWRNDSLKIIIACSDAPYHSAGDGKFAGTLKANDMKCHLENHTYVDALTYDYPSVSQINKIANEHGYTIIFATTKKVEDVYKKLAKIIKRSIYTELKEQSGEKSNVNSIVQEQYTKLVQKIKLFTNITDDIKLHLSPNCVDSDTDCDIKYKAMKNFTLSITATNKSCRKANIIQITTHTNDMLLLDIEVICSCPCEKDNNKTLNEIKCSSNGIFQCGICKCKDNRYGDQCQCNDGSIYNNNKYLMNKCKMDNNTEPCSGRGLCSCGVCIYCNKGFSGPFCQYDEKRCFNTKNEMCSNNGECIKGICSCNENSGWSGEYCNCQEKKCIAPYSDEVCSGRGICDCGKCICNKNSSDGNSYIGEYCDYCENCLEKRCELNKHILQICKTIDKSVVCNSSIDTDTIIMADKDDLVNYENAKWCSLSTIEDECSIVYKYKYEGIDQKLVLIVQKNKECPPETDMWLLIGATIGSILLVGLLTAIVWNILVDLHDKREFEKFKLASANAGWDTSMNPLYRAPEVEFMNPCFEPTS